MTEPGPSERPSTECEHCRHGIVKGRWGWLHWNPSATDGSRYFCPANPHHFHFSRSS